MNKSTKKPVTKKADKAVEEKPIEEVVNTELDQKVEETKKPEEKKKKSGGKFELTIKTGGEVYTAKTDDIGEAIKEFGLKRTNTKTIISVKFGEKTVEKVFNIFYARRLFTNNMTRLIFTKNMMLALNAV